MTVQKFLRDHPEQLHEAAGSLRILSIGRKTSMQTKRDMCPICAEPFQENEVVIVYQPWKPGAGVVDKAQAHLDCALYLSRTEERKHPQLPRRH